MKAKATIFLLFFFYQINSQDFEWIKPFYLSSNHSSSNITTGNLSVDYDGLLVSFKSYNIDSFTFENIGLERSNSFDESQIIRLDTNGILLWKKSIPNQYIRTCIKGENTYILVIYYLKTQINSDTFKSQRCGIILSKLNRQGETVWIKKSNEMYYANELILRNLLVDDSDRVYVTVSNTMRRPLSFKPIDSLINYDSLIHANYLLTFDKDGQQTNLIGFSPRCVANQHGNIIDAKLYKNNLYLLTGARLGYNYNLFCDTFLFYSSIYKYDIIQNQLNQIVEFKSNNTIIFKGMDVGENEKKLVFGHYKGDLYINKRKVEKGNPKCEEWNNIIFELDKDGNINSSKNDSNIYAAKYLENNSIVTASYNYKSDTMSFCLLEQNLNKKESLSYLNFMDNEDQPEGSPRIAVFKNQVFHISNFIKAEAKGITYQNKFNNNNYSFSGLFFSKLHFNPINNYSRDCISYKYSFISNKIVLENLSQNKYVTKLYNLRGQLLYKTIENNTIYQTIDLNDFTNGIYLVNTESNMGKCDFKFYKNEN
jgi:hypothetical protein